MCAIFTKAYNIACVDGRYEIRNEVEQEQTTEEIPSVSVTPSSNSNEPTLIYNPTTDALEMASLLNACATSPYVVCCDTPLSNAVVYTTSNTVTERAS